jgi:hypothetical protein
MVDPPLARLVIHIKVLQIVVKVYATGAQVPPEQRGVGGEDGGDVNVSFPAQRDSETCLPLVEVGDDGRREVTGGELGARR